MNKEITDMTWGDLFAGGGGTTTGALMNPNVKVLWALNHSKEAILTHELNHPETEHFKADIRNMNEKKCSIVDGLWASLECTNFSNAKGGLARDADSRTLAYELSRFIVHCKPKYIIIENVREFLSWGPLDENGKPISKDKGIDYLAWVEHVKSLGYTNYEYRILNSADYGAHTSRKRYFGIFSLPEYDIVFPEQTHHKDGINGFEKWLPCKEKIDLENTGNSIFGREFNKDLAKHVRRPLVERSLSRIAKGMQKHSPEMLQYIVKYYGTGDNNTSVNSPLDTITTKDRHMLVSLEKQQFISDHVWGAVDQKINKPMNVICTKESKQLVTVEKKQFISKYYGGNQHHSSSINDPLHSILTVDHNALITVEKKQFIAQYYGRNNAHQSIDSPINAITTENRHQLVSIEKKQFVTTYFGSSIGQSLEKPLNTIMSQPKHALTTILANGDFDIKIRFLFPEELGAITGFPDDYVWYGSKKFKTWMVGNAVPVKMAGALISSVKDKYLEHVEYKIAV